MITSTYSQFRAVDHPWLDRLPQHWPFVSLRLLAKRYSGGTPDKGNSFYWTDGTIPWLNSGEVNQGVITKPTTYITKEALAESSAKWIPCDAVVIALAGQGKTKGMTAITTFKMTCNQSVAAIVFDVDHPKFMYWYLISQYKNIRGMASDDARDGLNLEMVSSIPCPRPTLIEQKQIAAFLDWKTGQIDALIAKKQLLIEKLKEKRLAVITQAVTKGLDATTSQRDSGIAWIGDVTSHWEIRRFADVASVVRGASPRPAGDARFFGGDFVPWITVAEITRDDEMYLSYTETMLTEEGAAHSRTIGEGMLVLTNSGATLGVPKILAISGCANDGVVAFENLSDLVDKRFLFYYLSSLTENLRERMKQGGGQPNLNTDIVKSLAIPFPPIVEQSAIAAYLGKQAERTRLIIQTVTSAITRLTEYRTALITAATTGQIDVRNVTIPPSSANAQATIESEIQ